MEAALREALDAGDITLPDYLAHLKTMREQASAAAAANVEEAEEEAELTTSAPRSCSPTTAATSGRVGRVECGVASGEWAAAAGAGRGPAV